MLNSSPDDRPDITQVWFRVNELLPLELQKDLPDGSPSGSAFESHTVVDEASRSMPQRSLPSLSRDNVRMRTTLDSSNQRSQGISNAMENKGSMGAFWSTQHAQELASVDDKWSAFDKEQATSKQMQDKNQNMAVHTTYRKSLSASIDSSPGDYEIRFSLNGSEYGLEKSKMAETENKTATQTASFNSVAHFDDVNLNVQNNVSNLNMTSKLKEQQLEVEVILLKEQLKIANLEKEEISLKFDRLSAICSSQRREIQDLKKALVTTSATPSVKELQEHSTVELSPPSANLDTPPREKIEGTPPELRQGIFTSTPGTPSPDSKPWPAFPEPEEPKSRVAVKSAYPRSVRTLRASNSANASPLGQSKTRIGADPFAFGQDSFKADSLGTVLPKISNSGNTSQSLNNFNAEETKDDSYQPAGWTGF